MRRRGSSPFLTAAMSIGAALCREAYWYEGRCNWLGRSASEALDPTHPLVPTVTALGPDLYAGTSGVALFLAQLFALTRDPTVRKTAEGAIRQALAAAASLATAPIGLYGGALGVGYAAARVGVAAELPHLVSTGLELARVASQRGEGASHPVDIISGNAGAILGLLWLSHLPGGEMFLDAAVHMGNELLAAGKHKGVTWSWDAAQAGGPHMLTGLSHGATGIAVSLLELFARTGRKPFLIAGMGALAYEDFWFSAKHRNWPDLRSVDKGSGAGSPAVASDTTPDVDVNRDDLVYGTAWCHGAPGIGLARLRAFSLLPASQTKARQKLRASIQAAIESTLEHVNRYRNAEGLDVTPCHGLAGLTELLLTAASCRVGATSARASRIGDRSLVRVTETLWKRQIQAFGVTHTWPSGVPSAGKNPSLLLGNAGVGYSLLRLHDVENVPSFLMITT